MAGIDIKEPSALLVRDGLAPGPGASNYQRGQAGPRAPRRAVVRVAKYVLPLVALVLLCSIALWPEMARNLENGRTAWRRLTALNSAAGLMLRPRYHGLDGANRPYTVSADTATRDGPNRVNLAMPVGDLTLQNGTWLLLRAKKGVFLQHNNELDLSDQVWLYREDGTTVTTQAATMNISAGAGDSDTYTHAEGPFGTLDAQGFTLLDKGDVIQFHGPARLVLNGSH